MLYCVDRLNVRQSLVYPSSRMKAICVYVCLPQAASKQITNVLVTNRPMGCKEGYADLVLECAPMPFNE